MTDQEYTTLYVPIETRDRISEVHQEVADHPDALPIYATLESGLNSLIEDCESEN
jgi:hypothetical protein